MKLLLTDKNCTVFELSSVIDFGERVYVTERVHGTFTVLPVSDSENLIPTVRILLFKV